MEANQCPAVRFRNGSKTYKDGSHDEIKVLNHFTMTMPQGKLYSLLGCSGSGKTTILSCILGLTKLDHGSISIFGSKFISSKQRQRIGYMPQDVSLCDSLTIKETLIFFGTLFSLGREESNKSSLNARIKFLMELLLLPPQSRIVGILSGGQRRRVSFAVAVIIEPELLLLDEPTTGVDPLIRECIWSYLRSLVLSKGTSILLTTHYVDEAQASDVVGIMRDGRLVVEENPSRLLETFGMSSLEAVFLKLARQQEQGLGTSVISIDLNETNEGNRNTNCVRKNDTILVNVRNSFTRVTALAVKNYKCISRNLWALSFITLIPAFCMFVACIAFRNEPKNMSLGVVNNDVGNSSICFEFHDESLCSSEDLSCKFLKNIPSHTIDLISFDSILEAKYATEKGQTWGYIHFPENYSNSIFQRYSLGASLLEDDEGKKTWNDSIITLSLDQTNTLISGIIKNILYETLEMSQMNSLMECGQDGRHGRYPLAYKEPIVGNNQITSLNYFAPGLAIGVVFFFPLTVSIRMISEKRQGTVERCFVGGTKMWEILAAQAIPEFFILLTQSILVFLIIRFGFSIGLSSFSAEPFNVVLTLILCVLQGIAGLSCGFLLGVLCTEEAQAALLIIATVFPSSFISAVLWPAEGMLPVLQIISPIFPMTLTSEALRSMMNRGWGIRHPNVWKGFIAAGLYIAVPIMIIIVVLRKRALER